MFPVCLYKKIKEQEKYACNLVPFFLRLKKCTLDRKKLGNGFLVGFLNSSAHCTHIQSRLQGQGTCLACNFNSLQK